MNVLVVDDDRSTRFLLNRALTRRFGCNVTEAGNGQEALDALGRQHCQFAILDVQMPVVDGLETLRAVRESPEFGSLPVVMLTGERDEAIIREILELGVLEFMPKPLNIPRLAGRIRRILRSIGATRDGAPAQPGWLGRALLDTGTPAVVVEGRAAFRTLLADAIGTRRPVIKAESGVRGLRDCVESNPSVVFVGGDLGVLSESLFVKKIRATPALRHLPLVGIVDSPEDADLRLADYDGTVVRSSSPGAVLTQLNDLVRLDAGAGWDALGGPPGFRATVMLVCEQVLQTALAADVAICDLPAASAVERIVLEAAGGVSDGRRVVLELACDIGTARRVAANLFGIDSRIVRTEDAEAAAVRVFELISGGLRATYEHGGHGVEFETPRPARRSTPLPDPAGVDGVSLCFQPAAVEHEFWLTLRASRPDA